MRYINKLKSTRESLFMTIAEMFNILQNQGDTKILSTYIYY